MMQVSIVSPPPSAGRLKIGGSLIGGIQETQEMLDFCGKHNIVSVGGFDAEQTLFS